ncbi:unnamed protein product [Bursaphelenchus xylophilus]|uniref:(pine wood nematode) hypothetical protein n=1 Tax=Bursaphelenchus xylophilus TaxID=6326 RepID=A0A1I7SC52_BURXY|nr:unnamed protein product [Bursaphelenchus xylophilus]CAG9094716.1 unnamed protein product [Bursaphelenchus xylophilus]
MALIETLPGAGGRIRMRQRTPKHDTLIQNYALYERHSLNSGSKVELSQIEMNDSGRLMAVADVEGVISIWEHTEHSWERQSSWRYRFDHHQPRIVELPDNPIKTPPYHDPFSATLRPKIVLRWAHSRHGRYLAVAASNKRRVHIFAENEKDRIEQAAHINMRRIVPLIRWHRKHSMASAANVTEMQFCPPHMDMELATATQTGVVVIHTLENQRDITSWRPIMAIQVFPNQTINSLTWNRNPVHELAILVASTNALDSRSDQRIAIFPRKNDPVTPEQNMHFDMDNHVSCVSFAPSNGLNESILAIGVGRRIFLHTFVIAETAVGEKDGELVFPEDFSDKKEPEKRTQIPPPSSSLPQSHSNLPLPIQRIRQNHPPHSSASPRPVTGGHMGKNLIVGSVDSDSSPILPSQFFDGSHKDERFVCNDESRHQENEDEIEQNNGPIEELRGHFDEGYEETTDEEKETDTDMYKLLRWEFPRIAVFRESSAVRSIHWNTNPDGFTAEFCDGKLRSYKWAFGCVWIKSAELYPMPSRPSIRT